MTFLNKTLTGVSRFKYYETGRTLARPATRFAINREVVAALGRQGKWLEAGAGVGELGLLLPPDLRQNLTITEVDPECLAALAAKPEFAALDCRVADVRDLPFTDNEFDGVLSHSMLDVLSLDDLTVALGEVSRVSRGPIVHFLDLAPDYDVVAAEYPDSIVMPVLREKHGQQYVGEFVNIPRDRFSLLLSCFDEERGFLELFSHHHPIVLLQQLQAK